MSGSVSSVYLKEMVDEGVISAFKMKMSGQPTFYNAFPILDDHYNSSWVDIKGRCNYFLGASYRHHIW